MDALWMPKAQTRAVRPTKNRAKNCTKRADLSLPSYLARMTKKTHQGHVCSRLLAVAHENSAFGMARGSGARLEPAQDTLAPQHY